MHRKPLSSAQDPVTFLSDEWLWGLLNSKTELDPMREENMGKPLTSEAAVKVEINVITPRADERRKVGNLFYIRNQPAANRV